MEYVLHFWLTAVHLVMINFAYELNDESSHLKNVVDGPHKMHVVLECYDVLFWQY